MLVFVVQTDPPAKRAKEQFVKTGRSVPQLFDDPSAGLVLVLSSAAECERMFPSELATYPDSTEGRISSGRSLWDLEFENVAVCQILTKVL